MAKILKVLKKIIFAKWVLSKPDKKDVLIYDAASAEIFYLFFNKKDCEHLNVRYESINFNILLNVLLKCGLKNLKDNYKFFYIQAVSPKVVFTLIDNNPSFYKLKDIFNKTIYISIQISGRRNDFFDICKQYYQNPKSQKLKVDHMFVIGKNDIKRYSDIIEGKFESNGSLKNNYFSIKEKESYEKKINSILFISTKNKLTKFYEEERIIFNILYNFCIRKNIKLSICTKNDSTAEKTYRQNLVKGNWNYIPYIDMESTYRLINNSQMVVFNNSTLGFEAMSKKIKGAVFPTHSFPLKGYAKTFPTTGPFWSCNFNDSIKKENLEKNVEKVLENVINFTKTEWEKIIDQYILDIVEYNEGNVKLIKLIEKYNLPLKKNHFFT